MLLTIQLGPYLMLGLLAGAVADRANRRALMVSCDVLNALTMASLPVASAGGHLSLPHVYGAALLTATAWVFRDAANFGALPAIVGRAGIVSATSIMASTATVLYIAAPALGGVLVATIGPAQALWCDAVSYLAAALSLMLIRRPFRTSTGSSGRATSEEGGRRALVADMSEGLRYLRRHRVIGPLTLMGFGFGVSAGAVTGLLVIYGVRGLGLAENDARLGWLWAATGIGSTVTVALLRRLNRRFGQLRVVLVVRWIDLMLLIGVVIAPNLPVALLALAAWNGASSLGVVGNITLRQQLTPDHLQGRVNTTGRMIAAGGMPVGAALGGALAEVVDVRVAMFVMAASALIAVCWVSARGLRGVDSAVIAELTAQAEKPDHADHLEPAEAPAHRSTAEHQAPPTADGA